MAQQTWVGSDYVADVLLNDIPDNDTELYTRVGLLEDELYAARDGEVSLLAKEMDQDSTTTDVLNYAIVIEDEVHAARDGEVSLLAKENAQDALTATVTAEVVAARDGFTSLLAKEDDQDDKISVLQSFATTSFPDQSGKAFYTLKTDGTMPFWDDARVTVLFGYESRGDLRATVRADKALAVVEGLGLFVFAEGSDEPDDDESCFATSTGRWIMEAPHWDVVDMWNLPEREVNETRVSALEDNLSALEDNLSISVLTGTATCAIASVATVTSTAFTGTITGAAIGDRVLVTPPGQLGSDSADTSRLSFHAYVSATDTVSIYLCNASAATATTNTAIRTTWPVMVIKEI